MNKRLKFTFGVLAVLGLAGILGRVVPAGPMPADGECPEGRVANDKWLETQLEAAYLFNPHLNNFTIDVDVNEGDVMLSGTVRSAIDRDLAEGLPTASTG